MTLLFNSRVSLSWENDGRQEDEDESQVDATENLRRVLGDAEGGDIVIPEGGLQIGGGNWGDKKITYQVSDPKVIPNSIPDAIDMLGDDNLVEGSNEDK